MTARIRDEAIEQAAEAVVAGLRMRDSLPPRAAAEAAWTPTGPSVEELERRIRTRRGYEQEPADAAQEPRAA